jgi:hypothetical protein
LRADSRSFQSFTITRAIIEKVTVLVTIFINTALIGKMGQVTAASTKLHATAQVIATNERVKVSDLS